MQAFKLLYTLFIFCWLICSNLWLTPSTSRCYSKDTRARKWLSKRGLAVLLFWIAASCVICWFTQPIYLILLGKSTASSKKVFFMLIFVFYLLNNISIASSYRYHINYDEARAQNDQNTLVISARRGNGRARVSSEYERSLHGRR